MRTLREVRLITCSKKLQSPGRLESSRRGKETPMTWMSTQSASMTMRQTSMEERAHISQPSRRNLMKRWSLRMPTLTKSSSRLRRRSSRMQRPMLIKKLVRLRNHFLRLKRMPKNKLKKMPRRLWRELFQLRKRKRQSKPIRNLKKKNLRRPKVKLRKTTSKKSKIRRRMHSILIHTQPVSMTTLQM